MSYMKDRKGRRLDTFLSISALRAAAEKMPGFPALPSFGTGFTVGTPVQITSSFIAQSTVTNPTLVRPDAAGSFSYLGALPKMNAADYANFGSVGFDITTLYSKTSTPPWAVEFLLDTVSGAFETTYRGTSTGGVAVLVDGQYVNATRPTFRDNTNTGSYFSAKISGLSAGRHRIRLEHEPGTRWAGIVVGNQDSVTATHKPALRAIVIGDSFTEPTVVDTGTVFYWSWTNWLATLTGIDVWAAGSGGTGYLNPGANGAGRVKFRDRLSDITQYNPDIVIWAGGINDLNYGSAAIGTEAAACYAAVQAALPAVTQVVISPFHPRGNETFPVNLLANRDAIKAAAAAAGALYIDVLDLPVPAKSPAGTVQAATTANASTISSNVTFPNGSFIKVGNPGAANQEVRQIQFQSGSGPYTLNVQQGGAQLYNTHAVGEAITQVGSSFINGTGVQGSGAAGTAARYTGNDSTHPTVAGHEHLAWVVYGLLRTALAAA